MLRRMTGASGSGWRGGRRWAAPVLALLTTLSLAVLAVMTNLATTVVPDSLPWLQDGVILWPAVGVFAVLSAVLAGWAARVTDVGGTALGGPLISAGSGSTVLGSGAAIGAVSAGAGSVVMVASQGPVSAPVPAVKPDPLVVGAIPGEPPEFQRRPELDDLGRLCDAGGGGVCADGPSGGG